MEGRQAHPKGKERKRYISLTTRNSRIKAMPWFNVPLSYASPLWKSQCHQLNITCHLWQHSVFKMFKSDKMCMLQLGNSWDFVLSVLRTENLTVRPLGWEEGCWDITHSSLLLANKQETEQDEWLHCLQYDNHREVLMTRKNTYDMMLNKNKSNI